jgi:pilus assembly protein CpaB
MTRRRRACLLLGLAVVLGALAASNVSRRESALRAQLGPLTQIVVARRALAAGHLLTLGDLGVRVVPARYAPAGSGGFASALAGHRLAVPVVAGGAVTDALLVQRAPAPTDAIRRGQRAVDVVATGSPLAVVTGARVDVVVTTERRDGAAGAARLALQDVEVLAARAAAADQTKAGPRVVATLRVSAAQAVYLTAAQSFARDVRLLARAPGDRRSVGSIAVGDGL